MSRLYQTVAHNAVAFAEKIAVVEEQNVWTYAEFGARIEKAASGFATAGIAVLALLRRQHKRKAQQ